MDLQVINIKPIAFRLNGKTYHFFKPYYLMPENEFKMIKPVVKGSTIIWNILGTQLSYFQLKQKINDFKNTERIQVRAEITTIGNADKFLY